MQKKKLGHDQLSHLRAVPPTAFPNRVRVALDLLGVTQMKAAEETGIHASTLSQIINGKHADVKLDTSRRLAEYVGCAIEDLFPVSREAERASA